MKFILSIFLVFLSFTAHASQLKDKQLVFVAENGAYFTCDNTTRMNENGKVSIYRVVSGNEINYEVSTEEIFMTCSSIRMRKK